MIAALNDLKMCAADVGNIEFGCEVGSFMLIVRDLYGLKSSGASWASMLNDTLKSLGYSPLEADRNVWLRSGIKPDGFCYYQMILVYVDDILH
jgi:hypothetical protein